MPPHLVGPPYMVDQQGMALPPEIQGLIPGRHFLSPADAALLVRFVYWEGLQIHELLFSCGFLIVIDNN